MSKEIDTTLEVLKIMKEKYKTGEDTGKLRIRVTDSLPEDRRTTYSHLFNAHNLHGKGTLPEFDRDTEKWLHNKDCSSLKARLLEKASPEEKQAIETFFTEDAVSSLSSYNHQLGEDIIKQRHPHIYTELMSMQKKFSNANTGDPVQFMKDHFNEGWKKEWSMAERMDLSADAYKDKIVMEWEFSNRDICYRDILRFMKLFKEKAIDAAVLVTFADQRAAERWGKNSKSKNSTSYLTVDYVKKVLEEFKLVTENIPIWCIGIR